MIENEKLINFQQFRVLKMEREFQRDYGMLLENLSVSEIRSEVDHFVTDLKKENSLRKSLVLKGKLILQELKRRCFGHENVMNQFSPFVEEIEVELANIGKKL